MTNSVQKSKDFSLNGQLVYEIICNGDIEYAVEAMDAHGKLVLDGAGKPLLKRVPKCVLDLNNGNSEILSDQVLILDVDANYPTMLQKIAMLEGVYDDDEDFEEISFDTGEPVSEYELRTQAVLADIAAKRAGQKKENDVKFDVVDKDVKTRQEDFLDDGKREGVSGREEPTPPSKKEA